MKTLSVLLPFLFSAMSYAEMNNNEPSFKNTAKDIACDIQGVSGGGVEIDIQNLELPGDWEVYILTDGRVVADPKEVEDLANALNEAIRKERPDWTDDQVAREQLKRMDRTLLLAPMSWKKGNNVGVISFYGLMDEYVEDYGPVLLGAAAATSPNEVYLASAFTQLNKSLGYISAKCHLLP